MYKRRQPLFADSITSSLTSGVNTPSVSTIAYHDSVSGWSYTVRLPRIRIGTLLFRDVHDSTCTVTLYSHLLPDRIHRLSYFPRSQLMCLELDAPNGKGLYRGLNRCHAWNASPSRWSTWRNINSIARSFRSPYGLTCASHTFVWYPWRCYYKRRVSSWTDSVALD